MVEFVVYQQQASHKSETHASAANQHFAGDVIGKRRAEEQYRARGFGRRSGASQRAHGLDGLQSFRLDAYSDLLSLNIDGGLGSQRLGQASLDQTEAHAIHV